MTMQPTRRDVLARVAAAIAAAGTAGFPAELFAQGAVTVDQFLALSEKLTEKTGLDRTVAAKYLGGFLATGNGKALVEMIDDESKRISYSEVANAIVAAWYSGLYRTADGQAVGSFPDALLWGALTFTKPRGYCGGETGYWSKPPEA